MISNEPSRMYAALRCIEGELAKENPSIAAIRAIMLEAGRELRPTKYALDGACACREPKLRWKESSGWYCSVCYKSPRK